MAVNTSYNYYSSTYNSNTMRMSGLISGFDTDSIVSALLSQQQMKVDKQFQSMKALEYKKEAYNEVNTFIKDFRSLYMSVSNPDTNMQSTNTFKTNAVTTSDTTNAVTFTAGSSSIAGSHTISVKNIAEAASVKGGKLSGSISLTGTLDQEALGLEFDAADSISFSINGEDFTFTSDTTVQQMLSKINGNANANVSMSYSSLTGAFAISSKTTGANSTLELFNTSGNAFSADSGFKIDETYEGDVTGKNAVVTIDGVTVERSSNNFTIDGINYKLNSATKTDSAIQYSVTQDVDKAVKAVKSFVEGFNALVDVINGKLSEKKYSAYKPLTDEQRSGMTESEAKLWDERAKSGTLKGDSGLERLMTTLRSAFYSKVDGGKSALDIGISTMSYKTGSYDSKTGIGSKDNGKIQLDETQLRKALEANPDAVAEIFTKTSTSTSSSVKFNESGLAQRLYNSLTDYMYKTQANSMDNIDSSIKDYQDSMDNLLSKMADSEKRLYAQYTAMEKALSTMESQKNWISAQMGMGG